MKYKIYFTWTNELKFETDDKKEAIKFIKENEQKEYNDYLEYTQKCNDNYESYSDYYPDYYIEFDENFCDIQSLYELEK